MIREFQTDDTDAIVSLWRAASAVAHPFLPAEFIEQEAINLRNLYLPHAQTWVTVQDDLLVGFIAMIDDEIGGLFVDPVFHSKGSGKAMVDHVVQLKGPLRVEVFEQNAIGRRFYNRYGFAETGRYEHEPSGEMTLKLAMNA